MSYNKNKIQIPPVIVGTGLVVLDIILNNGDKQPVFNVGGTCANVLAGLSFLGWNSIAVSRCGIDPAGDILINDLTKNGINTLFITREKNVSTPRIIEKLNSNGKYAKHKFLLRCPSCRTYLPRFRSPRLDTLEGILGNYKKPDVFFFDRVTPSSLKLAKFYREANALIVFEPNNLKLSDKLEEAIRLSHVIKYAVSEDKTSVMKKDTDEFIKRIQPFCPHIVIKTLGKHGLSYRFSNDTKWRFQRGIKPDEIYDSCGAGDWCTASFIFCMHKLAMKNNIDKMNILKLNTFVKQALRFAQIVASISLKFVGARGLSNSMTKEEMFENYRSDFKEVGELNFLSYKKKPKKKKNIKLNQNIINEANGCKTCLLTHLQA